jgi:cob(I)alamin adenosyltransferase
MYNKRVSKSHPRIATLGAVDELNAAIGMARALNGAGFVGDNLLVVQKDLVAVMGEIATAAEDMDRYQRDGFQIVTAELTSKLDKLVAEIEGQGVSYKGWATPGATAPAGALDVARTVCRRAERAVQSLREAGEIKNAELIMFLNRLSDVLWLMARWVETKAGAI